jgi:REP element-mobilizing transposase RayT
MRGNHRQDIFFTDEHRDWLEEIIAEVISRFAARVHAYCWMTNHIHLLVQIGDAPLGSIMLRVASRYARKVQARFPTTGHLFERRHDAKLVDADAYLLELLRYIHLNPVRAKMVRAAQDYRWSSHHAYLGTAHQPWMTTDFALSIFHRERDVAVSAYRRFIEEASADGPSPLTEVNANDSRILGDDHFAEKVLGTSWRPRSRQTLEDIIAEVCREFSIAVTQLESRSAQRRLARARACIAHRCVDGRIASLAEVARRFGRDESTLRESMERYYSRP